MKGICRTIRQVLQTTEITVKHLYPQAVLGFQGHVPWFGAAGARVAQTRQFCRKRPKTGACIYVVNFVSRHYMKKVVLFGGLWEVCCKTPRYPRLQERRIPARAPTAADAAPRTPPNHSYEKKYVHMRNLGFPFNGICVVYHGLCIYAHVPEISASCT